MHQTAATTSAVSSGSGSSTNTGAIAGGVVGGVCGAFLIVGIIWFFSRRGRQAKSPSEKSLDPNPHLSETPSESSPTELGADRNISELNDDSPFRKELPADAQRLELSGNTKQPPSELA